MGVDNFGNNQHTFHMKRILLLLTTILAGTCSFAQWSSDTTTRNLVCQSHRAYGELMCGDGHKGAIIAWMDQRNSMDRIYVQRLDSNGVAKWGTNGKMLSSPGDEWAYDPIVLPDGHGGAVIFFDISIIGGGFHIYAQRLDANGNELWVAGGVPVSVAQDSRMRNSEDPATNQASADGDGGAFITWQTYGPFGISAQHIDKNGNPVWGANGLYVTSLDSTNISYGSNIVNTGKGTAAVAWGYTSALYMQRISATGTFLWPQKGLLVADSFDSRASYNATSLLYDSTATTKNITVAWEDARNQATSHDIYAQKIDENGNFLWKNKGLPVAITKADDVAASMLIDKQGGFYMIFDSSSIACLQHVDKNGNQLWGKGLRPKDGYNGINPVIGDDGSGGVIAMWNFNGRLYSQKYNKDGITQWRAGGIPVIVSQYDSMQVSNNHTVNPIVSLEDGTAIACWTSQIGNIYAAKFGGASGLLPVKLLNFSAALQKNVVTLQWITAQEINSSYFDVERSVNRAPFTRISTIQAAGSVNTQHTYATVDENPLTGINYYRLKMVDKDGDFSYSQIIPVTMGSATTTLLYPNPVKSVLTVKINAVQQKTVLNIYDAAGRIALQKTVNLATGENVISWNVANLTTGGYYLTNGNSTIKYKFIKQ